MEISDDLKRFAFRVSRMDLIKLKIKFVNFIKLCKVNNLPKIVFNLIDFNFT